MKNIKLMVFDMAGTTVDEDNVVYKTLQKAITAHGISVSLATVLEFGAGKEKHQAIKDVIQELNADKSIESTLIFNDFKVMLNQAYQNLVVREITGVEKLMLLLKQNGIKIALNTGYNSKVANILLQKLNWQKGVHYDALITADDVLKGRPAPDMIIKAMELLQIENSINVLKAGDSAIDILEGKNANCGVTVGVLSGAQTKQQLAKAKPTYILNSLSDLLNIIDFSI